MKKERLDILLVNRGLFESRAKAQAAVMAGQILVNEQKIDKPGTPINPEVTIRILGNKLPYVSRGGLKLEKALQIFPISVQDKVVADIGASTGGFTDCALQNGAAKVYAIDVGYGQLAWKLRNDERVVNMERTNVRYLFGRVVKEPAGCRLLQEGCREGVPERVLEAADEELSVTPLMQALAAKGVTVAQFGQAIGAMYYAAMER